MVCKINFLSDAFTVIVVICLDCCSIRVERKQYLKTLPQKAKVQSSTAAE